MVGGRLYATTARSARTSHCREQLCGQTVVCGWYNDGGNVPPGYEMGHLTEQDGAAVGAREV